VFTKEIENLLKALPDFVQLFTELVNPVENLQHNEDYNSLFERISKSFWMILPFHFFVLFSVTPDSNGQPGILARLLLSALSLVAVIVVGAAVAAVVRLGYRNQANGVAGFFCKFAEWATAFCVAWFITVATASAIILGAYLHSRFILEVNEPDIQSIHSILSSGGGSLPGWIIAGLVCAAAAAACTVVLANLNMAEFYQKESDKDGYSCFQRIWRSAVFFVFLTVPNTVLFVISGHHTLL